MRMLRWLDVISILTQTTIEVVYWYCVDYIETNDIEPPYNKTWPMRTEEQKESEGHRAVVLDKNISADELKIILDLFYEEEEKRKETITEQKNEDEERPGMMIIIGWETHWGLHPLPMYFSPDQWDMVLELADVSNKTIEDCIFDIAHDRFKTIQNQLGD